MATALGVLSAVIVGFSVGVMIYGVAKSGFGMVYTVIPLLVIFGIARNSHKQKRELQELRTRNTAPDAD